jgi:hypothetical protein
MSDASTSQGGARPILRGQGLVRVYPGYGNDSVRNGPLSSQNLHMAREAEFAFSVETRTQRCFHVLSLACQNQPKSGRDILFTPHAACYPNFRSSVAATFKELLVFQYSGRKVGTTPDPVGTTGPCRYKVLQFCGLCQLEWPELRKLG